MAVQALHPQTTPATLDDFERLYAAWRHAKGTWEAASYAPEYAGGDLPRELEDRLSDAHCGALNDFLMHPVNDFKQLARKLRVFRDEDICDGWTKAPEIVAQLAKDASRLAFDHMD